MELSNFLTQAAFLTMSKDEKMEPGYIGAVTFTGLVVVFLALILLVCFLTFMGAIMTKGKKKQAPPAEKKSEPTAPVAPAPQPPVQDTAEEEAVVAAITAAISMLAEADGTTYQIKSIRPAKNAPKAGRPAWYMAGLRDNTTPF